jgi:hypothetical protein
MLILRLADRRRCCSLLLLFVVEQTGLPATLYTIDMRTTMTTHSGTFNGTAFSQAVMSVISVMLYLMQLLISQALV